MKISPSEAAVGVDLLAEVGDNFDFCGDSSMISPELDESRFQASKPWGACITELGCSSSSDLGLEALSAASAVSSCILSARASIQNLIASTSRSGLADFGSGVWSSTFSAAVSSISVVLVPFDEVDIGEGSAISLGLCARGEGWV